MKVATASLFLLEMDSPERAGGRRSMDGFRTASWATSWFPASVTEDKNTEKDIIQMLH